MSTVSIEDIYDLATFFLKLSPQQRKSFLQHTTREQCEILRQASYNILLNTSMQVNDDDKQYLNRHISSIRKLASTKICNKDKQHILYKKYNVITRILKIIVKFFDTQTLNTNSEIEAKAIA